MPYFHCPTCRITIYKQSALAGAAEPCPRCSSQLRSRARSLFASRLAKARTDAELPVKENRLVTEPGDP